MSLSFDSFIYLFLLSSQRLEHPGQWGPRAWKAELLGRLMTAMETSLFRHVEHLAQDSSRQPVSI